MPSAEKRHRASRKNKQHRKSGSPLGRSSREARLKQPGRAPSTSSLTATEIEGDECRSQTPPLGFMDDVSNVMSTKRDPPPPWSPSLRTRVRSADTAPPSVVERKKAMRAASTQAVSFSPSTQFNECRHRGNMAVPRDAAERKCDEDAGAGTRRTLRRANAMRLVPSMPRASPVSHEVGHRLFRTNATVARVHEQRRPSTEEAATQDRASPRSPSPATTPSTPSSASSSSTSFNASNSSLFALDVATPSPMDVTLLSDTTRLSRLSTDSLSPSPRAARSPDVDAFELSLPDERKLHRVDVVCIRAAAPSAAASTLASRIEFSHPRVNYEHDDHRDRHHISEREDGAVVFAPQDDPKRHEGAAMTEAGADESLAELYSSPALGEPQLQDCRYIVDVSAVNLATMAANARQAEKAARTAAAPSTATADRYGLRTAQDPAVEASSQSLFSVFHNSNKHFLSTLPSKTAAADSPPHHQRGRSRVGDDDAAAAATAAPRHGQGVTVELLKDEDERWARASRSRSVTGTTTSVSAAAAPAPPDQAPHRPDGGMRKSGTSLPSTCSYSLPSQPRHRQDGATPAPMSMVHAPTTVIATSASPSNARRTGKVVGFSDLGFEAFTPDGNGLSEGRESVFSRQLHLNGEVSTHTSSLSSVSDPERLGFSPSRSSSLFLLTPLPSEHMLLATTPTVTPRALAAAAAAAAAAARPPISPASSSLPPPRQQHQQHRTLPSIDTVSPAAWSLATAGPLPHGAAAVPASKITARHEASPLTPNKATLASSFLSAIPSPLAPLRGRSSRRLSEVNASSVASSTTATPTSARIILPHLVNDDDVDRRNTEKKNKTQLHVLHGSATESEVLTVHAPVHPSLSLPRGSARSALTKMHNGDVHNAFVTPSHST